MSPQMASPLLDTSPGEPLSFSTLFSSLGGVLPSPIPTPNQPDHNQCGDQCNAILQVVQACGRDKTGCACAIATGIDNAIDCLKCGLQPSALEQLQKDCPMPGNGTFSETVSLGPHATPSRSHASDSEPAPSYFSTLLPSATLNASTLAPRPTSTVVQVISTGSSTLAFSSPTSSTSPNSAQSGKYRNAYRYYLAGYLSIASLALLSL